MTAISLSAGFALPAVAARVSDAAAMLRACAIAADPCRVELRLPREPVDQRSLNCCVSCALGAAMEIIDPNSPPLAPMFHYHVARFVRSGGQPDGSLDLDVALSALSNEGICREELHRVEFDDVGARTRPSQAAFADGRARAIRPRNLRARFLKASSSSRSAWAREQLRLRRPVVIGFLLPISYVAQSRSKTFMWLEPDALELSAQGHCVLVTGFDDLHQALHVRDSRGGDAFDAGYWWLGYRVADSAVVLSMASLIR